MTELIGTRIDSEVVKFLKIKANEEGRTLSGMINFILQNEKNRVEKNKRKDNE